MCANLHLLNMTFRTSHLCLIAFFYIASISRAQDSLIENRPALSSNDATLDTLPEAPLPVEPSSGAPPAPKGKIAARTHETGPFDALIDPTEIAPHLTAFDKVGMGIKQSVSPFALLGWLTSATYGEAINGSPNYGQDGKAYLQRIGAASAKAGSETIFTTSVLAPILHEDPRYFVLGPGHNGFKRTTYAIAQIFLTPTDKGGTSVNFALLGGNLAGSALTQAYYPSVDRGVSQVLTTFGTSLAGSAVKYIFDEFFYDQAHIAQLKRKAHL